jgi:hypothetical protein
MTLIESLIRLLHCNWTGGEIGSVSMLGTLMGAAAKAAELLNLV